MPTVRQIAEQAGVSISTVSLALNNKKGVSDATRRRVLDVAAELRREEKIHHGADDRTRSVDRPLLILVLHPAKVDDDVFSQSLRGLWAAVAGANVQLQLTVNEPDFGPSDVNRLLFSDPDLLPDGVLALGARKEEPLLDLALAKGIPCVLVQRECDDPSISAVGVDETKTAFEATEHLIELGHRAIAFVGGRLSYAYTDGRLNGYRQAMAAHGIEVPPRWISLGWDRTSMARVLDQSPEITGVVFIDDGFALDFGLPVLQEAGLRVPDNVSVVSFDDIRAVREYNPPITSAAYPFYEISFRALKVLEEQIRDPLLSSQHIRFNATLKERTSTAPPAVAHD
ncbi:MAG: LacI family DNA-binding transcriptional regulator [Anaerolineae bacterium]